MASDHFTPTRWSRPTPSAEVDRYAQSMPNDMIAPCRIEWASARCCGNSSITPRVSPILLVPSAFPRELWRDLKKSERYYVRMLDMELKGATKVADFQSFAKSFAYADYAALMASTAANAARLAGAADLKGRMLDGDGFAATLLRKVLFAMWKTIEKEDPKLGVTTLKTELGSDYWQHRQKLILLADYISKKTKKTREEESTAAHELAEALRVDRV